MRPSTLAALLVLGTVLAIPFLPAVNPERELFALEVRMHVSAGGTAQVYYSDGGSFSEAASTRVELRESEGPALYRFAIPPGHYESFRFDPVNGAGTMTITSARVVRRSGAVLWEIPLEELRPVHQIATSSLRGGVLVAVTDDGAYDPQFLIAFEPPLRLELPWIGTWQSPGTIILMIFAGLVAVLLPFELSPRLRSWVGGGREWFSARPVIATMAIAAVATIASTYPVVFFGKSFVSPNFSDGFALLYGRFPTLPGYDDTRLERHFGSDIGAMGWHHLPLSIIQHRGLVRDGELPLWNRYNRAGAPLLGQGQSIFGNPLHVLPLAAGGAAFAWDIKYLLAKWLFCFGIGLTVLRATRSRSSALISAASAAFIGFFIYRLNHPAFFSLCYSPWILYSWLRLRDADTQRAAAAWAGVLLLSSWTEMNSGTVKEAYMLLLSLNFTGAVVLLAAVLPEREKLIKLGWAAAAGVVLVLIGAPVWLTFLDALREAYTSYDLPRAHQIDPKLLIGLFDEIFYRPVQDREWVYNPSVNFLALAGVLYVLATLGRAPADRLRTTLLVVSLLPFSLAFGFIPASWVVRVPFLRNIDHIDNTFTCVLIVHLLVLAGFGYKLAAERLATRKSRADLVVAGMFLLAIVGAWVALTQDEGRIPVGRESVRLLPSETVTANPFVWGSLIALTVAVVGLALVVWRARSRGRLTGATAVLATACVAALLWRHGQHLPYGFSDYVFNPGPRADLRAKSDAIEFIRAELDEPGRVIGVYDTFIPGWSAAYDLETISGPDALQNPLYRELTAALGFELIWDWRIYVQPEVVDPLQRSRDMLNVSHLLELPHDGEPRYVSMNRVARLDLDVYASETVWPRAFFTDRVARHGSAPDLARLVRSGDGRPFAAAASLDEVPMALAGDLEGRLIVPASNYRLTTNTTTFDVEAPGAGLIVLHEVWEDGDFRATVNGRPADYIRVNHAFKAVAVDAAGDYTITFSYWPKRFTLSLILFAIGLAALAGAVIFVLRTPSGDIVSIPNNGAGSDFREPS